MAERNVFINITLKGAAAAGSGLKSLAGGFLNVGRQAVSGLKGAVNSLFNLKNLILGGLVYGAYRQLKAAVLDVVGAYLENEKASANLLSALQATGQGGKQTAADLDAFAASLASVTTHSQDSVQGLMAVGINAGVGRDRIKGLTQEALGLAKSFGVDATAAMKALAFAEEGQVMKAGRLIPGLKEMASEEEQLVEIHRRAAIGWQQVQGEAGTTGGKLKQIGNMWGELKASVGKFLMESPAVQSFFSDLKSALADAMTWIDKNKDAIQEYVTKGLLWLKEKAVEAWNTLKSWAQDGTLFSWFLNLQFYIKSAVYGIEWLVRTAGQGLNRISGGLYRYKYEQQTKELERAGMADIAGRPEEAKRHRAKAAEWMSPEEEARWNRMTESEADWKKRVGAMADDLFKVDQQRQNPLKAQNEWLAGIKATQEGINAEKAKTAQGEENIAKAAAKTLSLTKEQRSALEDFATMGKFKQMAMISLLKRAPTMTTAEFGALPAEDREAIAKNKTASDALRPLMEKYAREELTKAGITKFAGIDLAKPGGSAEKIQAQATLEVVIRAGEDVVNTVGAAVKVGLDALLLQVSKRVEQDVRNRKNYQAASALALDLAG